MERGALDRGKLALAVRLKRGERRLEDASAESGLPLSTLSRIENEKHRPDIDTYAKVCDWLGLPMDYFRMEKEAA